MINNIVSNNYINTEESKSRYSAFDVANKVNGSIISSFSNSAAVYNSSSGLNSSLLYRIYDFKAISLPIVKKYYENMQTQNEKNSEDMLNELDELKEEKEKLTEELDELEANENEMKTADEQKTEDTDSSNDEAAYELNIGENRGYDYDAVKKYYDNIIEWQNQHEGSPLKYSTQFDQEV